RVVLRPPRSRGEPPPRQPQARGSLPPGESFRRAVKEVMGAEQAWAQSGRGTRAFYRQAPPGSVKLPRRIRLRTGPLLLGGLRGSVGRSSGAQLERGGGNDADRAAAPGAAKAEHDFPAVAEQNVMTEGRLPFGDGQTGRPLGPVQVQLVVEPGD